jgi:hypothetical protein
MQCASRHTSLHVARQILGADLDLRSDIFSLGTMLYELIAGAHPFLRASAADTMAAIMRDAPAGCERDLDAVPGLGHVVHRMLAKACGERHQTTSALRAEIETLRERSWSTTPSAAPAATGSGQPQERTPFVGRESEIGELEKALDRMLLGQGSFILLGGEPGVGKTRLAREIQRLAHRRGCLVMTGQCYEQESAPPYGPFVEISDQAARTLPQAYRAALGESAPEIAALVLSLRRIYHDRTPVVPPDQRQRRLLFSAYLDYIRRATLKSAVVLLLTTCTGRTTRRSSCWCVVPRGIDAPAVCRDVPRRQLDAQRPLPTRSKLLRQRLATRIQSSVSPRPASSRCCIDDRHVAAVVARPGPALETDGNPFLSKRCISTWRRKEAVRRIRRVEGQPAGRDQCARRRATRHLPTARAARRRGSPCAVGGCHHRPQLPLDILGAIADVSEDTILDVVEQAERAQLAVAERSRDTRYAFVHELIRSTLIDNLSLPRRQRLHLKVAEAVERLRAGSLDAYASMLAHHFYQAGAAVDDARTADYLLRAGRARAQQSGAFEERSSWPNACWDGAGPRRR